MLQDEIDSGQRLVKTDAYQLSIGEIVNMYRDEELIINPDFQRLFRWEIGQKSRLIESLLLGIPLPSIFVFERHDSTWELIDGLQRISTLLEFMGILRDPTTGQLVPPSSLVATKYLTSLNNAVWEKSKKISIVPYRNQIPIESSLQLAIRRARLSVEILKRPSENATKYDLFQRLNAGGTPANAQELRNCIIIMVSDKYSDFMRSLADSRSFLNVLSANEDQIEKQRHMEFVSRFLVHVYVPYDIKFDVEEYINEGIIGLAEKCETRVAGKTFLDTFDLLDRAFGGNAFRRLEDGSHGGRVSLAAFECIAVGIGKNIKNVLGKSNPVDFVRKRVEEFWESDELDNFFSLGMRGTTRIQRTVPFGDGWFSV